MGSLKNQRGMAFLVVLLAVLICCSLGMSLVSMVSTQSSHFDEGMQSSQAFYVAEGGMQYIIANQLINDPLWNDNVSPTGVALSPDSIRLDPGEFWVEYVVVNQASMTVRVTGRVGNSVRVIQQDISRDTTPPQAQYGAYVGGDMNMTNTYGHVYGDITHRGNFDFNNPNLVMHDDVINDIHSIFPTIDLEPYRSLATTTMTGNWTLTKDFTGNVNLEGDLNVTSGVQINGLIYVQGDVSFSADNIHVMGSIVSEGNISAEHINSLTIEAQPSGGQMMPAIVSNGTVEFLDADALNISGMVWSDGAVDMTNSDNIQFSGALLTNSSWTTNSANNIDVNLDSTLPEQILGYIAPDGSGNGLILSRWKED